MIKITNDQQMFSDGFKRYYIPSRMIEGLESYINQHLLQGSFLHAVLCNDLLEAIRNADHWNMANLPAIVNFLYNYAPRKCFGSPEKVEKWLNNKE